MNRLFVPRRGTAAAALVLAAAGLTLAGCKGSSTAAGSASSPAAGHSSKAAGKGSSSSGSSGSGSSGTSLAAYFPVGVGDTWVYKTTDAGISDHTVTNKMTKVAAVAGGDRVTMTTNTGDGRPLRLTYIFHSDGSITMPLSQLSEPGAKVALVAGKILWPSAAQLASGQPYQGKLIFTVTVDGHTIREVSHVKVRGGGTQSVTVPAGTYNAQVVDETMTERFDGVKVTTHLTTWVVNGVGPVKSDLLGSADTPGTVEVLKSFTKG
jgi:hypothetical protein